MDVNKKRESISRILLLGILLTFVLSSCKDEKKEVAVPKDIVAKDTMVQILAEFHLLESSLGIRIFEEHQMKDTRNAIKNKVYQNYGVSRQRFIKSYNYYAYQTDIIDSLYADVISELSKRQAEQLK